MSRWWGACGLGTLAFAVITAACAAPTPSPEFGSSSPSQSRVPLPTGAVAEAYTHWQRIDLPDAAPGVPGGGLPRDVAAFGDGYVAVGTINASCCAGGDPSLNSGLIWTSKDARTWSVEPNIAAFEHASLRQIMVAGSHLIVFGLYAAPALGGEGVAVPTVWTSADGVVWNRFVGGAPDLVVKGGPGFVGFYRAEGRPAGLNPPTFMKSADGTHWARASAAVTGRVQDLIATPDGGALAVGWVDGLPAADGGATFDAMAWQSADGLGWTGPALIATGANAMSAIVGGPGYLAIGSNTQQPVIWSAPDGRAWRQEMTGIGGSGPSRIFVVPGGFLITGDAAAWFSRDGRLWGRVPDQDGHAGNDLDIATLISIPDGVLAVGDRGDPATLGPLPAAWLASP